ncbi:MAG: PQQ-dependent sugar dehydrogenase [Planctomycetes bacterium]|nr:PQQ-dependent sugar dehydrogenase [Planctomycetota bacterium]
MRRCLYFAPFLAFGLFAFVFSTPAEQAGPGVKKSSGGPLPLRKAYGIEKRVPWTTSKVVGSPEPPPPYKTEPAFPTLPKFDEPLDMTYAPGTNRLFVAERMGKIYSFLNKKDVKKSDLALELKDGAGKKQTIYAFTFHPKFAKNGYMYVTWIPDGSKEGLPRGTRVSRFTVKGEPPVADRKSEKIIFEWPNGGHNGGCLKFGPDDYLYIVTGDGSGIGDQLDIGQNLSSIFAKLLRIDVDHVNEPRPSGSGNYSIPKDNPFVKMPGARPEVYAYGLRQLWRFSFDRRTGDLWGGEVGQDLWEMVYKIEKGGNYGWSVKEGTHPFRPDRKKGPTPILNPVVEHPHSDFRSITGGFVYRGKRLADLGGLATSYIYGDFDTGRIWMYQRKLAPEVIKRGGKPFERLVPTIVHREIARTTYRIVTWAEDAAGELYFVDFTGGGIHQLVKAPAAKPQAAFPRKLSETGIFSSTKNHKIAPGVIPYSVNAQLWGDHAVKERFLAIPGNGQIGFDEITYPQPSPGAPPGWRFPDGTVLVKTFSMDMERGNPKSRKRLETRILHFQQFPGTQEYGDQYWRGYTYVWNDAQTDAELLDEKGLDKKLTIKVGNKMVEQNYRFPSRAECTLCHTNAAKFALGVSTMQMNRFHYYPASPTAKGGAAGAIANQLATLEHIGIFTKKLPKRPEQLPKLADFNNEKLPIDVRARSYLHSNCSHCHIKWGGGNAEFKLVVDLPLKDLGIVNVPPAHGNFKIAGAKLLVPGHPEQSILLKRMNMTGLGRMPHIGSRVIDEQAVRIVGEWIKGLK